MKALLFHAFRRAVVACLLGLITSAVTYAQEQYAILVGVSGYPYLSEDARLDLGSEDDPTKDGPANDVLAMKATLMQRGFDPENILVLADGISGTILPTRDNIIEAFRATSAKLTGHRLDHGRPRKLLCAGRSKCDPTLSPKQSPARWRSGTSNTPGSRACTLSCSSVISPGCA